MQARAHSRSRTAGKLVAFNKARARERARKISITVEAAVLRDVEKAARRSGRTLSAEITESLSRDLRRERLRVLIEEYEKMKGTITEAELVAIRKEWQG